MTGQWPQDRSDTAAFVNRLEPDPDGRVPHGLDELLPAPGEEITVSRRDAAGPRPVSGGDADGYEQYVADLRADPVSAGMEVGEGLFDWPYPHSAVPDDGEGDRELQVRLNLVVDVTVWGKPSWTAEELTAAALRAGGLGVMLDSAQVRAAFTDPVTVPAHPDAKQIAAGVEARLRELGASDDQVHPIMQAARKALGPKRQAAIPLWWSQIPADHSTQSTPSGGGR